MMHEYLGDVRGSEEESGGSGGPPSGASGNGARPPDDSFQEDSSRGRRSFIVKRRPLPGGGGGGCGDGSANVDALGMELVKLTKGTPMTEWEDDGPAEHEEAIEDDDDDEAVVMEIPRKARVPTAWAATSEWLGFGSLLRKEVDGDDDNDSTAAQPDASEDYARYVDSDEDEGIGQDSPYEGGGSRYPHHSSPVGSVDGDTVMRGAEQHA
jgi:hypothetical protein